jgi:hypothetical protein
VTSNGAAPKNYIAFFTTPCNIEGSLIFEKTIKLGKLTSTTVNLSDALYVNGGKLGFLPTTIGGCSGSQTLGSIAFGANNTCTGFAIASDGTNTYINAPGTGGAVVLLGNGSDLVYFNDSSGHAEATFHIPIGIENAAGMTGFSVDTAGNLTDNGAAIFSNLTDNGAAVFSNLTDNGAAVFNAGITVQNGLTVKNGGLAVDSGFTVDSSGNVQVGGNLQVNGQKNFQIDDPLDPANRYLYHSAVESSEMMNIYTGNVTTNEHGDATVQVPAWFEALNGDFRYQLTVIGQFAQAIVASEIRDRKFTVKTDKPNVKVSWLVTGARQDAYAKAHPLVVEQDKQADERGYYLHPELFGQPETKSINQARQHQAPVKETQSAHAGQVN